MKLKSTILPRVIVSLYSNDIDTTYAVIVTDRKTRQQRTITAVGIYAAEGAFAAACQRGRV